MPQSLAQIYLHIVFSTKDRRPFLQETAIRDEMHSYLGGICNNLGCPILRVGGVADHVHLANTIPCNRAVGHVLASTGASALRLTHPTIATIAEKPRPRDPGRRV